MASDSPKNSSFGGQYPMRVFETTLTVAAGATTATDTSRTMFKGTIEKIEIDPGAAMATSATLKGYEANTDLATGTRDHFLNYTFPESEAELVIYPLKPTTTNDGSTATDPLNYVKHVVNDNLRLDLASAAAGNSVTVRVYVRG